MLDDKKFHLIISLNESYLAFEEALLYLINSQDKASIIALVENGINALTPYLGEDFFKPLKKCLSKFDSDSNSRLIEFKQNFTNQAEERIIKSFEEILNKEHFIEEHRAIQIFKILEKISIKNADYYMLWFDICEKISFSAPLMSFNQTLKIFEERPDILANEGNKHPNYVYSPSPQRTFNNCIICGGEGEPYYRAFTYNIKNFSHPHLPVKLWMKCKQCDNMYTWKHPEEQLLLSDNTELIYPEKYKHLITTQDTNAYNLSDWNRILCSALNYTPYANYHEGVTLLEVGVGKGELLAVALELGLDVNAVEIESKSAQKIANMLNINVWRGDFLKFSSDKHYSIIIMGDVIEHIINPKKALMNAYELLKDDGVLWISTPNFESAYSKMTKFKDFMWCVQNHVTYFSFRGIKMIIEECGFKIADYKVSRKYNGSMELILIKRTNDILEKSNVIQINNGR